MINNERGGIISSIFMIPIGIALMIGFFFLGYYVGKYQSKSKKNEIVLPLPEIVSKQLPQKEEFTFYKTLTDKGNTTVSIELKPKPEDKENEKRKKSDRESVKVEPKAEKPRPVPVKQPEPKKMTVKKEPKPTPARETDANIRYTLQIASYPERDSAEADARKMKQRGYAAFVVSSNLEEKGTWYRVRLGSFSSRASAERLQRELKAKEGITPIITIE
jgi:cell division protein FtsN